MDKLEQKIKRFFDKRPNIKLLESWDKNDFNELITLYLSSDYILINDISKQLNKSIDDIIAMMLSVKLRGKMTRVQVVCSNCEQSFDIRINEYLANKNYFCSPECYSSFYPNRIGKGKQSRLYHRVKTTCTNCDKPIEIPLHRYNMRNRYGESHNFCSHKCYGIFRKNYYVAEKHNHTGRILSEETRKKMGYVVFRNSRSCKRFDSKIQLDINSYLDEMHVDYTREKIFDYYAVDNYLDKSNLIIEVMGDYWHGNPLRYNENRYPLNDIQFRTIHKDKCKYTYIKNNLNIEILYLWETDIMKNPDLCKKLIKNYIDTSGNLLNYHSFNYHYNNGALYLNNNLLFPYQQRDIETYRHLRKKTGVTA